MNKNYIIQKKLEQYDFQYLISERHYPYITIKKLPKGSHIFREGDMAESLFIFLNGKIRIYKINNNGKIVVLYVYDTPEILGEVELIYNHPTLASIDLLKESEFIIIPMSYCRKELLKDTPFINKIAYNLARNFYKIETNSTINISYGLENKVISYILSTERNCYFELDLTILPDVFGTTYRHLLRVIKKLRENGIIEKSGKGFLIKDKPALLDQEHDTYILN